MGTKKTTKKELIKDIAITLLFLIIMVVLLSHAIINNY